MKPKNNLYFTIQWNPLDAFNDITIAAKFLPNLCDAIRNSFFCSYSKSNDQPFIQTIGGALIG